MSNIKTCIRKGMIAVLFLLNSALYAERIRILVKDMLEVNGSEPLGVSAELSYSDSALILLGQNTRFVRGLELELTVPQNWLPHSGSLAFALYSNIGAVPGIGTADVDATQILYEPVPNKIQTVYHIPLRERHGLRGTPYLTLLRTPVPPEAFPLIFRLTPNVKGWSREIETMRFQLAVKPILSDEGTLTVRVNRPEFLPNGSFIMLIDEQVVENPEAEMLLKEGEHTLTLISSDYRNENRRFVIERGGSISLSVNLQDLTPLIIFETPKLANIFIDDVPVARTDVPLAVEPGVRTVRIQLSDYSIAKTLIIEKGKTYRMVFTVNMDIAEVD